MSNSDFMKSYSAFSRLLKHAVAGVLLLLLFQACVHAPKVKKKPCNDDPAPYQQALLNLSSKYKSLAGKVKVQVESRDGKVSFTGDLYAQSPGKLHFDIFGFLHRPRFILIKNGDSIAWKDFDSGRSYTGPLEACPGFPVKFPFSPSFLRDFMRILFLDFPGHVRVLPPEKGEEPCRFLMMCRWGIFDMTVDSSVGLPVLLEGPQGESARFRLSYGNYAPVSSLVVPRRYGIAIRDVRMTFEFKTLKVNPPVSEKVFVPVIPR